MFNHMYGSPFPTINPKVRYKTALERAGFDTNFRGALLQKPSSNERRNVSECFKNSADSIHVQQTRVHSLPGLQVGKGGLISPPTPTPPTPKNGSSGRNAQPTIDELPERSYGEVPVIQIPYAASGPAQKPYFNDNLPINQKKDTSSVGSIEKKIDYERQAVNADGNSEHLSRDANYGRFESDHDHYGITKDMSVKPEHDSSNSDDYKKKIYHQEHQSELKDDLPSAGISNYSHHTFQSINSLGGRSNNPRHKTKTSAFDFELSQSPKSVQDMNPIEKSFMMLTQSGSGSSAKSSSIGSQTNSIYSVGKSLQENSALAEVSKLHIPSVKDEDFSDSSEENDDDDSLNFEPCAELNFSLSSSEKHGDSLESKSQERIVDQKPEVPGLKIIKHLGDSSFIQKAAEKRVEEYAEASQKSEKSNEQIVEALSYITPNLTESVEVRVSEDCPNQNKEQRNEEGLLNKDSSFGNSPLEDVSASHTATNLQVEKLLAQLNDVSDHKNAQLDMFAHSSSNVADRATTSPTANESLLSINSASHFKKSSAYLSGYPMNNVPQSITIDDDSVSTVSKVGDTPLFYNFKQHSLNNFAHSKESILKGEPSKASNTKEKLVFKGGTLEPSQLKHKTDDEVEQRRANKSGIPDIQEAEQRISDPVNLTVTQNPDGQSGNAHERVYKFSRGEGPCRLCGLEVTHKAIFSKGDNELSGQWHRECFRCLKCNIRFSKQTPCYILADEPYCQQHYHEENNSICKICDGFIEGECLENDRNERFHVSCLTCFLCKTEISNDYFIYNEELPLCGHHDVASLIRDDTIDSNGKSHLSKRRTRLINFSQS